MISSGVTYPDIRMADVGALLDCPRPRHRVVGVYGVMSSVRQRERRSTQ